MDGKSESLKSPLRVVSFFVCFGKKVAGLAVAVVGLTGYGIVRLATWPIRALLRSRRPEPFIALRGVPRARSFFPENKFVKSMLELGRPAFAYVVDKWAERAMKKLEKNLGVMQESLLKAAENALLSGLVLGNATEVNAERSASGDTQLVLHFAVSDQEGNVVSERGVLRLTVVSKKVHAFYEKNNGEVVDLFIGTNFGENETEGDQSARTGCVFFFKKFLCFCCLFFHGGFFKGNVVDAEIVDAEVVTSEAEFSQNKRKRSNKKRKD